MNQQTGIQTHKPLCVRRKLALTHTYTLTRTHTLSPSRPLFLGLNLSAG